MRSNVRTMVGAYPLDVTRSDGLAIVDRALQSVRKPCVSWAPRTTPAHKTPAHGHPGHWASPCQGEGREFESRHPLEESADQRPRQGPLISFSPEAISGSARREGRSPAGRPRPRNAREIRCGLDVEADDRLAFGVDVTRWQEAETSVEPCWAVLGGHIAGE